MSTRILQMVVLCLVALAVFKLLFFHTRIKRKREVNPPNSFWQSDEDLKRTHSALKDVTRSDPPSDVGMEPRLVPPGEPDRVKIVAPLNNKDLVKIVHLDLKGAAPKVKYLEQIFPLLSYLGASGVLLEYEDMFPYDGDLKILRSPHAYSMEDIQRIKEVAKLNKLDIIPLVQVMGHLEFVLKHKQYLHLREVSHIPNSLNPQHPASLALVKAMVTQVLTSHPEASYFHMGADEVFGLGGSQHSINWMGSKKGNVGTLFLNHAVTMATFISEARPGLGVMMWDDMLRKISPASIRASGLQNLATPVIWDYLSTFNANGIGNLISRYETAGFEGVWFASAFKGASEINQIWPPLNHHLKNHLAWLKVMTSMSKYPSIALRGILLTGWQRYEHYTVLCELLPVGIPSLAVCLQTLNHGSFSQKAKDEVHQILGCEINLEKNICEGSGAFAGSQVYHKVYNIHTQLQSDVDGFMKAFFVKGAFTRYQRRHNFANPRHIEKFQGRLKKLLDKWETYMEDFRVDMDGIFFTDAVDEWMEENVNAHLDVLREYSRDAERLLKLNGQPKS